MGVKEAPEEKKPSVCLTAEERRRQAFNIEPSLEEEPAPMEVDEPLAEERKSEWRSTAATDLVEQMEIDLQNQQLVVAQQQQQQQEGQMQMGQGQINLTPEQLLLVKQEEYQNEIIGNWIKRLNSSIGISHTDQSAEELMLNAKRKRGARSEAEVKRVNEPYMKLTRQDFHNMHSLQEEYHSKKIGEMKQATKFPVFKDVQRQWSFNYQEEERKRLKAVHMWDPSYLASAQVASYVDYIFKKWPKHTGMSEEVALKVLMECDFCLEKAAKVSQERPDVIIYWLEQLSQHEEKIELMADVILLLGGAD